MIQTNQDAYLYIKENVSRETFEQLCLYHDLLVKWNKSINLVSSNTINEIWLRHILDSYQIVDKVTGDFADLGSGAGFPGLVCAIITQKTGYLIESDEKKCTFLRNVSRETNAPCHIINKRIEETNGEFAQITSRALTSVKQILTLSQYIRNESAKYILLKGKQTQEEISNANATWDFDCKTTQSITSDKSYIVELENIRKKQ